MAHLWQCSVAECIRAIKGPYISATVRETYALTPSGREWTDGQRPWAGAPEADTILRRLAVATEPVGAAGLADVGKPSRVRAAIGALVSEGLVEVGMALQSDAAQPRTVEAVALVAPAGRRLTAAQARVVRILEPTPGEPVATAELARSAGASRDTIHRLIAANVLERRMLQIRRVPQGVRPVASPAPTPTIEQDAAIRAVLAEMGAPASERKAVLLHGVTGSGKTEVYLAAIDAALRGKRGAILIVPEIALTAQTIDIVTGRFGSQVALLHSRLGAGERYDEWARVADGSATVAVGARSGVFAPVRDLGLIVLDEEHEQSYKQDSTPRYHARDVAIERARRSDATVVLGSATPSLETYHAALSGAHRLVTLGARVGGRRLPEVTVVDMRQEFAAGPCLFSRPLREGMQARLDAHEQMVLFLNRRGYSQFVLCRDCGYVARCSQCSVSLTFHSEQRLLRCHHCGASERPPEACPHCRGLRLRGFGLGTERIEQEVLRLFPEARVARMDRDTTTRKGSHGSIVHRVRSGEADVLIGTQMVAKGLDFPNVTLVGVVSADTGLHIADFRAAERTFQLLAQVSGRSGRGDRPGQVVIQTFSPDHYAVVCAAQQDYAAFYEKEIAQRRELSYPPFGTLANIVATHAEEHLAQAAAQRAAVALRQIGDADLQVLGPAPAPLARLKGRFRWHVVVRAPSDTQIGTALRSALSALRSADRGVLTVDVGPMSMS
jgi:primosomal protein N' (replication factor Y)